MSSKGKRDDYAEVGDGQVQPPRSYCQNHCSVVRRHPSILYIAATVFVLIAGAGVAVVLTMAKSQAELEQRDAITRAKDTGDFFADQLNLAMLPLFSLAQIIRETDDIWNLPDSIGHANQPGSLPTLPDRLRDGEVTHRNVTGSKCVDEDVYSHYAEIASTLKKNANMDGVLVALELLPYAVLCLAYPLYDETFDPPLDFSFALGHDLLQDPARVAIAEKTVPATGLVTAGPLTLSQCDPQAECSPVLKNTIIARLPIASETHTMTVKGETYNRWGFAVALINWPELVHRSDIFDKFAQIDQDFLLTKVETKCSETCEVTKKTLAETDLYESRLQGRKQVTLPFLPDISGNEWEMTISYEEQHPYKYIWIPLVMAFLIAGMTYMMLFQKQTHADILAEKQAQIIEKERLNAVQERELNDFIAHEVRNPLSAAISATTFVAAAVNEVNPMESEESRVSVREDISIIDTSLEFINELLRNILDVHKVSTKSLVLDETPIGILHDLFNPVSAMLYKRDEPYEIIMDCSEDLTIIADKLRLQQVILNLARNSSKFVEKGYIRLKAEVHKETGMVVLSVQDSGPGVPESKRNHLFSRYQTSLDKMNQGTGVGLNLCKQIVDVMEGDIYLDESFESGIEGCPGSSIVIELNRQPISPDLLTEDIVAALDKEGKTGIDRGKFEETHYPIPEKLRVLFVDDDRVLRKLAMRSLQKYMPESWIIQEASSGEAALKLVEEVEEPFDLIFLDQYMSMAGQSLKGTETAKAMRAKGVESTICGLSANNIADAFHKNGADAFVIKPFPCKPDELRKTLRHILYEGSRRGTNSGPDGSTTGFTLSTDDTESVGEPLPLVGVDPTDMV